MDLLDRGRGRTMADDDATGGEMIEDVEFHVLRGPEGEVYMFSQMNLDRHRMPDEAGAALLEAFEGDDTSGFGLNTVASFSFVGSGKLPPHTSWSGVPFDTWVDTM